MLREEGADSLAPEAIDAAIADAASLRQRYHDMIDTLGQQGTVIACDGTENHAAIEKEFKGIGLKVIGPTQNHLKVCAQLLAQIGRDAVDALKAVVGQDATSSTRDLVERVVAQQDENFLLDMAGAGAALNNQSIVFTLSFGGRKILLGGDMQFAEAEISDLETEMTTLRKKVKAAGPFDVIKSSHHTSYNGWDDTVADEQLIKTRQAWLIHSGGLNDPKHPDSGALSKIKKLRQTRAKPLTFLRTDRNGQIHVNVTSSGAVTVTRQKGKENVFTANADVVETPEVASSETTSGAVVTAETRGDVEVTARIPYAQTRVTITVAVDPATGRATPEVVTSGEPASGETTTGADPQVRFALPRDRQLPKLLFITDVAALGKKIGTSYAQSAVKAIRDAGQKIVDTPLAGRSARQIATANRTRMADVEGVVLLGDVDVVPSQRLDVLSPDLRNQLDDPEGDPDNFIVWNDEVYGCIDGDDIPELPVSRIPDGHSASILAAGLAASAPATTSRFGIRNVKRPFADKVFVAVTPTKLRISQPTRMTDVRPAEAASDLVYFMLHGDDTDTRRFWGETSTGTLEAFSINQVPARFKGVVFAGCCWGALTATKKASDVTDGEVVTGRTPLESVAVRFVAAGAQAFIGCTGVHYSPPGNVVTSAGAPMHVAFFSRLKSGEAPARALYNAKRDCIAKLKAPPSAEERAIDLKVIRQFTCLGLGW